jgi:hypothetical protein
MSEFTLKSVVEFLEGNGFHVREAAEIGEPADPLGPAAIFGNPGHVHNPKIKAIRLEIALKSGD